MSWMELLSQYGYLAIVAGVFFEGDLVVLGAATAARHGLLHPAGVFGAAMVGAVGGDVLFFMVGRRFGQALIKRRATWEAAYERVVARMAGRRELFAFGVRFLYGMRNMAALAVGISGLSPGRFVVLNLIGSTLWAGAMTGLGYAVGEAAVEAARAGLERWGDWVTWGVAGAVALVVGRMVWRLRQLKRMGRGGGEGA